MTNEGNFALIRTIIRRFHVTLRAFSGGEFGDFAEGGIGRSKKGRKALAGCQVPG